MHNDNKPPEQWVPFDLWVKTAPPVALEQEKKDTEEVKTDKKNNGL